MLTSNTIVPKTIKNLKLSIQFSLDGFSFCIEKIDTKKTLFFKEYYFSNVLQNPESLLKEITAIFKSDNNLQRDFNKVLVIHQNNLTSIVPDEYFNEAHLKDYLNYTIKTLPNDLITFDNIEKIGAKNIYIPYVNINNYLFQNFGEFEYQHHATVLITKIINAHATIKKQVFVNVAEKTFDVIVIENKKLILYNNFNYNTKEDFIYYILFVMEQLNLDKEKTPLFFSGKITKSSELFKIAYTYIRNILFLESNNGIFTNLKADKHSNFILLG